MNKIIKYGWRLLLIAPLVIAFGVYINNSQENTNGKTEIFENQINPACSKENIDWDIAVDALSKHYSGLRKQNPKEEIDLGPAEIERHFAENCEEDLKIYNRYLASYDWVTKFFNDRIKELVGIEKYENIIKYYTQPKEFSGCEDYFWDLKKYDEVINEISPLMKKEKYKKVITLSNKYLNDSEIWYCDPYLWTQRAQAFYNLNNCSQALVEAAHAFAVAPDTNEDDEEEKEFYFSILESDICKID